MHDLPYLIELIHASTRSRLNHVVILLRGELLDALVVSATTHGVHSFVSTLQHVRCRVSPSHYACVNNPTLAKEHSIKRKCSFEIAYAVLRKLLNPSVLTVMHPYVCLLDQHMPVEEQLRLNFPTQSAKRLLSAFFLCRKNRDDLLR